MEKISSRDLTGILIMIIISGILVSGGADRSMGNAWIASAVAVVVALPLYMIYARITGLFPGKGFFEIAWRCFGKVGGGIIIGLLSLYALYTGAMSMRYFSEFNQVVSMPETSQTVTLIFFGAVCIYIMKKGISCLGKFTSVVLPVILFLIVLIIILSAKDWKIYNIKPILENVDGRFASDIFTTFAFPLGEVVLLTTLFGFKKSEKSGYKIYLYGLIIGGAILVIETLRSILVLGPHTISLLYYPSYTATGIINIMDFFTRIEVVVSGSFLVAQIVKVCLCIYAFSGGIGSIIGCVSYKTLVVPTVLFMISVAMIIFKNTLESYEFMEIFRYFAIVFQIALPLIVWIGAEITGRNERKLSAG